MSALAPPVTETLRPDSAGSFLAPEEFDQAEFVEGWRYELINGLLIVSPSPSLNERDPNELLGHLLATYSEGPNGAAFNLTTYEHTVKTGDNRRRADRVVWAGLGRLPKSGDPPTIVIEFVSAGRRNRKRDYEAKKGEYRDLDCREYWIFDRFNGMLTVIRYEQSGDSQIVLKEDAVYSTPLLPGFELPLSRLFERANRWVDPDELAK